MVDAYQAYRLPLRIYEVVPRNTDYKAVTVWDDRLRRGGMGSTQKVYTYNTEDNRKSCGGSS